MVDKHVALWVALACVGVGALAQVAMKLGMRPVPGSEAGLASVYTQALLSPWVWLGLCLYGASAVAWLWVLSRLDVGVAYPLVSLGFVLTALAGVWWLGEAWSWQRVLGVALVVLGVLLLARDA